MRNFKEEMEARMEAAVRLLRSDIVKSISRTQPTRRSKKTGRLYGLLPSLPGEPPKVVTTRLRNSIATDVSVRSNAIRGRVGTNVKYAKFLEFGTAKKNRKMARRPFFRPAFIRNRKKILDRLTKPLPSLTSRRR